MDTKSFPTVVEFRAEIDKYEAPRNALEARLCEMWGEVLSVENVGIEDDFFAMGGSSIDTIGLVTQLQSELNLAITIKDFYVHGTINIKTRATERQCNWQGAGREDWKLFKKMRAV